MATHQVRFCGFGGQGIVLAGLVFGHAAIADGKWATCTSTYGPAARGGACRSDVVISDQPIVFPQVIEADVMISMSQPSYDKYIASVEKKKGRVIFDRGVVPREIEGCKQFEIPATRVAIEQFGKPVVANMIILGAFVGMTELVSRGALVLAARENVPEKLRAMNVRAIEIGLNLGKEKAQNRG